MPLPVVQTRHNIWSSQGAVQRSSTLILATSQAIAATGKGTVPLLANHSPHDTQDCAVGAAFRRSAGGRKASTTALCVSMYGPPRRSMQ